MGRYTIAYALGLAPWEHYGRVVAATVESKLDREASDHPRLGRALDLGCGRGGNTTRLAARGWEAVGVDAVPKAIEAATRAHPGPRFLVGDVTDLSAHDLGCFDLFLDIGCMQGLQPQQRRAVGRGVTALANPGATLLMLAFGITRARRLLEGVDASEVAEAFPGWEIVADEPAETRGLGWPMSRTRPRWLRLRLS